MRGWVMTTLHPQLAASSASPMRDSIPVGQSGRSLQCSHLAEDHHENEIQKARAQSPGLFTVVGTGVDPVTYRFSGGRSAN